MHILTYVQVYVIVAYFYKCTMEFLNTVQSLSRVQLFVTPWSAACQDSLSIPNSQSLPKLMFIELVMPSNHLILCRPFLLLPSIFPRIRVFSNELALCIRWPNDWSFSSTSVLPTDFTSQETKIMASGPITLWQIDGETVSDFFGGAPKSLQMVIAAMKLKDAYSLEGKL